jgi:hypothetical protein
VSRRVYEKDNRPYDECNEHAHPWRRRGCWWALLVLAVLVICLGGGAAILLTLAGQPNSIRVTVEPGRNVVAVNDQFTVSLTIENVSLDAVTIDGIGLDNHLLDGASVTAMDPLYQSAEARNYPLYGKWTEYTLDQTLLGGEKLTATLTLTALRPGTYSGDLTVWVRSKLLGLPFSQARRATLEFKVQ